jgi:hypothetical protein
LLLDGAIDLRLNAPTSVRASGAEDEIVFSPVP